MPIPKRRQWYVDKEVQKDLAKRLFFYLIACILFVSLPIALVNTVKNVEKNFFTHVAEVFYNHWPIMLTIGLMLPFAVNDMIRLSNRFAGPVFRLRRELATFAETGHMKEVFFRDNDFWKDLAFGVNRLTRRIRELEEELADQNQPSDVIEDSASKRDGASLIS